MIDFRTAVVTAEAFFWEDLWEMDNNFVINKYF